MTDEELKNLVAENSLAILAMGEAEARRDQKRDEAEARRDEELRAMRETEARRDEEMRAARRNSDRLYEVIREETKLREERHEQIWQEVLASRRDSDRLFESIHRDLGRLGNKQGDYTEALFRPSLTRVLREQFGMTVVLPSLRIQRGGDGMQIDMLAHADDEIPEVYVVEIKTQLRKDAFDQLFAHLRKLPRFFPEHRGKRLFGVLAALDVPDDLRTRAAKEGLYLATIKDDVFEIAPPDDFEPQAFGLRLS